MAAAVIQPCLLQAFEVGIELLSENALCLFLSLPLKSMKHKKNLKTFSSEVKILESRRSRADMWHSS